MLMGLWRRRLWSDIIPLIIGHRPCRNCLLWNIPLFKAIRSDFACLPIEYCLTSGFWQVGNWVCSGPYGGYVDER